MISSNGYQSESWQDAAVRLDAQAAQQSAPGRRSGSRWRAVGAPGEAGSWGRRPRSGALRRAFPGTQTYDLSYVREIPSPRIPLEEAGLVPVLAPSRSVVIETRRLVPLAPLGREVRESAA